MRPSKIPGALVRPVTGGGFILRLLMADASVGMIADTRGSKEGPKVGNTIGALEKPER